MQDIAPSTQVFQCCRCSHCCYFKSESETPVLLPHEVALLKVLAKKFHISEKLVFKKLDTGFYRWLIKEYCPFYDPASKSCIIHHDKPLACRMFPLIVNLTTMELSVSKICTWVNHNNELLARGVENPSSLFPDEMSGVHELLEILGYAASSGFVVIIVEKLDEELNTLVRKLCRVVRVRECSSIRGLYLLYLTECSSDEVEQILGSTGAKVVAVAEFAVKISQ